MITGESGYSIQVGGLVAKVKDTVVNLTIL